ncbi:hypothetical protein HHK36_029169 [Tetracentron sinense]|uniref:DEK-C domain-containing protein n=1 Tax=Tetracentron sinense TaxID=13715 RepID=A0A835D126_TETSI|nr:hypothetical protein HHK36_029169 [Tetracentron sinense]
MEPETERKVKETVIEILKNADMDEMTESQVRNMAAEKLRIDLSGSDPKRFVRRVVESFLKEKEEVEVAAAEEEIKEEEEEEEETKSSISAKEFDGDGDLIICRSKVEEEDEEENEKSSKKENGKVASEEEDEDDVDDNEESLHDISESEGDNDFFDNEEFKIPEKSFVGHLPFVTPKTPVHVPLHSSSYGQGISSTPLPLPLSLIFDIPSQHLGDLSGIVGDFLPGFEADVPMLAEEFDVFRPMVSHRLSKRLKVLLPLAHSPTFISPTSLSAPSPWLPWHKTRSTVSVAVQAGSDLSSEAPPFEVKMRGYLINYELSPILQAAEEHFHEIQVS